MKKILLLMLFTTITVSPSIAECKTKISVFPLKAVGGKEAEDISRASYDIILSQLLEKDTIIPLSNQSIPTDDKDAAAKALKDGSDYALTGGFAVLGKTSTISIRVIDSKTASPVHSESKTAAKADEIPELLSKMCKEIKTALTSDKISDKITGQEKTTLPEPGIIAVPVAPTPPSSPKPSLETSKDSDIMPKEPESSQDLLDPINKSLIFKTPTVDERIISLARVSQGKDKEDEIIAITRNQTLIYKKDKKGLSVSNKPEAEKGYRNLRVDSTDLNGDGKGEIFLTQINTSFNTPVTRLGTLDGGKLIIKESRSGFFAASAYTNCNKSILIQKEDRGSKLYSGEIFQVTNKGLDAAEPFKAPSGVFLDNFLAGKITDKNGWLLYTGENKMVLKDDKGEEEWEGDEAFGGSMESMEKPMDAGKKEDTERKFFKQRLIGFCDQTGKTFILTVKNEDIAKGLLSGLRKFTSGKVVIYGWSGIGLKEIWSSEAIPGGIHDIELFDADGDGKKDIIFAASIESTFKSKGYLGSLRLPEKIAVLLK